MLERNKLLHRTLRLFYLVPLVDGINVDMVSIWAVSIAAIAGFAQLFSPWGQSFIGVIRPFVQGDSPTHQRTAVRFAATLAIAHIAMAGFLVMLIYQAGTALAGYLSRPTVIVICSATAVAAVVVDIRAAWKGTYSLGLKRQTAKSLAHQEDRPWWVTPVLWGLDTGLIGSTFRVSCASWILLLGAFLNIAPQWSGLVYGAFFGIPLLVSVLARSLRGTETLGRPPSLRFVQVIGIVLMVVLPIWWVLS